MHYKIQLALEEMAVQNYEEFEQEQEKDTWPLSEVIDDYLTDAFDMMIQGLQEQKVQMIKDAKEDIMLLAKQCNTVKELIERIADQ